jgi:hypothetical protein
VQENENARVQELNAAREHEAQVQGAVQGLLGAQEQLAYGDSDGLGPALDAAEHSFTGIARESVQEARYWLSEGDLSAARTYLSSAIVQAEARSANQAK